MCADLFFTRWITHPVQLERQYDNISYTRHSDKGIFGKTMLKYQSYGKLGHSVGPLLVFCQTVFVFVCVCRRKPIPDLPLLQPGHRADRPGTGRQGVPVCGGGSTQTQPASLTQKHRQQHTLILSLPPSLHDFGNSFVILFTNFSRWVWSIKFELIRH